MTKKQEKKSEKIEREYIIPLRRKFKKAVKYKKTPRAVKAIKEFLVQHMQIRDRDLNKIKIDIYLNEFLWKRGIRNPVHKIKIRAVKEIKENGDEIVTAYLIDYPKDMEFKKKRLEKLAKESADIGKKKKAEKKIAEQEAKKEEPEPSDKKQESEKKEKTAEEKAAAGVEKMQERAKQSAKVIKHSTGGKTKEKAHPKRQVMNK